MPRGNDPDAATEFAEKYGEAGNAEQMIVQHRRSRTREVAAASLKRLDPVATNALDLDKVEKALDGDGQVVSAAVRGGYVIAVVETNGVKDKKVLPLDKAGISKGDLKSSRETLGLPETPVGEIKHRAEGDDQAVTAAKEADDEERERLEGREAKRLEGLKDQAKKAEKERSKES